MFNPLEGEILYIDKPLHWSSFDAVKRVRGIMARRLKIKKMKVGHAGTLDPLATGVMIVCTGKATKRIDELQAHTKEYVATIALGATTPSFDLETEIDATYPTEHITREMIEEVLKKFTGRTEQVPPAFSACKIDGKRAYKMARKGKEVELKAKILVIDEIEVLKLVAEGKFKKEIAAQLHISERTVKNHISNIFKKIQVSDRTQAAVFAIRNDIIKV